MQNLIHFNHALQGNWLWRFATKRDALWTKVVEAKYDSLRSG